MIYAIRSASNVKKLRLPATGNFELAFHFRFNPARDPRRDENGAGAAGAECNQKFYFRTERIQNTSDIRSLKDSSGSERIWGTVAERSSSNFNASRDAFIHFV